MAPLRFRVVLGRRARQIRHHRSWRLRLSPPAAAGLFILLGGAIVDILVHGERLTSLGPHAEAIGHIITLAGMVLILARVCYRGLQSHRR
jgi:hypothetical protein